MTQAYVSVFMTETQTLFNIRSNIFVLDWVSFFTLNSLIYGHIIKKEAKKNHID